MRNETLKLQNTTSVQLWCTGTFLLGEVLKTKLFSSKQLTTGLGKGTIRGGKKELFVAQGKMPKLFAC